eukprot:1306270-Karenia_brevis.AAC.1
MYGIFGTPLEKEALACFGHHKECGCFHCNVLSQAKAVIVSDDVPELESYEPITDKQRHIIA